MEMEMENRKKWKQKKNNKRDLYRNTLQWLQWHRICLLGLWAIVHVRSVEGRIYFLTFPMDQTEVSFWPVAFDIRWLMVGEASLILDLFNVFKFAVTFYSVSFIHVSHEYRQWVYQTNLIPMSPITVCCVHVIMINSFLLLKFLYYLNCDSISFAYVILCTRLWFGWNIVYKIFLLYSDFYSNWWILICMVYNNL